MISTVDDLIEILEKYKKRFSEFGKYIICVNDSNPDDVIPTLKPPKLYINTNIGQVEIYTDDDEDGFQKLNDNEIRNIEKSTEQKNENKSVGGLIGWICPKCGRCYSPFTSMCSCCGNGEMFRVTCNSSSDITDLNIFKW